MLSFDDKLIVNQYLEDSKIAKQISFELQRDELIEKYPNAIFVNESDDLFLYIYRLLHNLPFSIIKSRYLEEILMYLYEQDNHYLVSCTKEIYPTIGKKHNKKAENIERALRYSINKDFLNIRENIKQEYFSVPEGIIPTNFYFLVNLAQYVKTHYFEKNQVVLTKEQEEYFFNNLVKENNALYILEREQKRKTIEKFLYEQLGFFRYQASVSSFMLVDIILHCIENNVCSILDFYENVNFVEKWQIYDIDDFNYKMNSISFTIVNAFRNINPEVYKQIFGDTSLHRAYSKYIFTLSNYLKKQDYTRGVRKEK